MVQWSHAQVQCHAGEMRGLELEPRLMRKESAWYSSEGLMPALLPQQALKLGHRLQGAEEDSDASK